MNTLEIHLNKGKMILMVIVSIAFVAGGAWIYFVYSDTNPPIEPIVLKIFGVVGMFFFGLTTIIGIKRTLSLNVGIAIDSEGIHDFTNKNGIDCIHWEDIKIIHETAVLTTKMIQIDVRNPEEYIAQAKNGVQRSIMKSNLRHHGSPFVIASGPLSMKHADLLRTLKDEWTLQQERLQRTSVPTND